jgi:hypothetical protein
MALHDELLNLAKELVDRNPGAAIGGDLRRAVSTAYYYPGKKDGSHHAPRDAAPSRGA